MKRISCFKVRGTGAFPVDMLRYDSCWPTDSASASAISMNTDGVRAKDSKRTVALATAMWPTVARWGSFGWKVVEEEDDIPL